MALHELLAPHPVSAAAGRTAGPGGGAQPHRPGIPAATRTGPIPVSASLEEFRDNPTVQPLRRARPAQR